MINGRPKVTLNSGQFLKPGHFFKNGRVVALICSLTLLLQACGLAYRTAGNVTVAYSEAQLVPYVLSTTDLPMACATGTSLNHLLMSFTLSGSGTEKIAVFEYALAAFCVEQAALDAELDTLRAIAAQNAAQANDARIRQQRLLKLAAQRQYSAYLNGVEYYGRPADGCPRLDSDTDQLAWLLAMLSGLQAVINNMGANSEADIPSRVLKDVIYGSQCLDSEKWWQLPLAIRSGLWAIAPALSQSDDPWEILQQAAENGQSSGVRLAAAVYLITAASNSDEPLMRNIIRNFSHAKQNSEADHPYALLDAFADALMWRASDKLWTQYKGHRTPAQAFGTFWDDRPTDIEGIDLDDLL
jgi:hypothetical protein